MTNEDIENSQECKAKKLALLMIRLLVYKKELHEAEAENICPQYIKCLEEMVKLLKEEISGAIAL